MPPNPIDPFDQIISWHVELSVRAGALQAFKTLTAEMMEVTREELGVLLYERFIDPDEKTIHVLERYATSEAAVAHLLVFKARFAPRFGELVVRRRFEVFGSPSAELKALLDGFGSLYFSRLNTTRD